MNENGMRELLKDSADAYYVSVFRETDRTGKLTWNWAACCGGTCWLAYRKMYWFALSYFLLTVAPPYIFLKEKSLCVHLILFVIFRILLGFYGNSLYCFMIKKRIKNGHYLNEKYKGTHIILLYLNATFLGAIVAFIIWVQDKVALKDVLKDKRSFNVDLSEKNILAVVSSKIDRHYLKKFCKIEDGKLISFNWAAFCGGTWWFFFKKMYGHGFVLLALVLAYYTAVLGGDILILCGENREAALSVLFSGEFWLKILAPKITFLLGANYLYYRFCSKKLKESK